MLVKGPLLVCIAKSVSLTYRKVWLDEGKRFYCSLDLCMIDIFSVLMQVNFYVLGFLVDQMGVHDESSQNCILKVTCTYHSPTSSINSQWQFVLVIKKYIGYISIS